MPSKNIRFLYIKVKLKNGYRKSPIKSQNNNNKLKTYIH